MAIKPTPETDRKPKNVLVVYRQRDETEDNASARIFTKPEIRAARTIQQWNRDVEVNTLAKTLALQISDVNNGNMNCPEAMLLSQAQTLDELFNNLAQRAHNQEYLRSFETYLRLALKAQSQCRATLETLAAIKNPPIVYAKQANIAAGHQQVNNGLPVSHAEKIKNQPNALLTELSDETLDSGRTGETIPIDQAVAALE